MSYSPTVRGLSAEDINTTTTRALEQVESLNLKDLWPKNLPEGFQQKIAIARAIATDAPLMILDEPISSLDPEIRDKMRFIIRQLVKELGLTAIHVTHDQNVAMSVADVIILMKKGEIVSFASPEMQYGHPVSLFEAFFEAYKDVIEG